MCLLCLCANNIRHNSTKPLLSLCHELKLKIMTKEEKIQEAYGVHFGKVKNLLDSNGWCSTRKRINFFEIERDLELETQGYIWRPESLFRIEDNNGWIKIQDWNTITRVEGIDIVFTDKGNIYTYAMYRSYSSICEIEKITHFQQLQKPKPPIY